MKTLVYLDNYRLNVALPKELGKQPVYPHTAYKSVNNTNVPIPCIFSETIYETQHMGIEINAEMMVHDHLWELCKKNLEDNNITPSDYDTWANSVFGYAYENYLSPNDNFNMEPTYQISSKRINGIEWHEAVFTGSIRKDGRIGEVQFSVYVYLDDTTQIIVTILGMQENKSSLAERKFLKDNMEAIPASMVFEPMS